jgi:hypothetical protein
MLIVMKSDATDSQVEAVLRVIEQLGFRGHPMPGATRTAIGVTGNQGAVDPSHFENLAGVAEAIRVSKPYKLITLDLRPEKTVVRVGGDATIGGDELAIIAGPCARRLLQLLKRSGAVVRDFSVAALTSRGLLRTRSKGLVKRVCGYSQMFATLTGSRSLPKPSTKQVLTWLKNTAT